MRAALILVCVVLLTAPAPAGETPEAIVAKAVKLSNAGDYDGAVALLRDGLDAHPDHPEILLELGRISQAQAFAILSSENPSLGRVALFDAKTWFEKAVAARPRWDVALKLLGGVAIRLGEWKTAADAWERAAGLDPEDGESRYQLGYCLANDRRFSEAIAAFDQAERILGPDPRIYLNRGISQASAGQKTEAVRNFRSLIRTEVAAKRRSSASMKSGVLWLWKVYSRNSAWEEAERTFAAVAEEVPDLSSGWWYLGHARRNRGNATGAAEAFGKVTGIVPNWAEGWRQLGVSFARAGEFAGAEAAVVTVCELDPESASALELLFTIATGLETAGRPADAAALLARLEGKFPDDYDLIGRRGDVLFRGGKYADAVREYRRAAELDPFGDELRVKEQKAVSALLRAGAAPEDLGPLRPEPEAPTAGKGGVIVDFESPAILARHGGLARGGRSAGAYRVERIGSGSAMAYFSLTFMPTIDTTGHHALRFDVKGPKDTAVLLRAKDCYDEFGLGATRLLSKTPVTLTGERQTVDVPLTGFESDSGRPIPMNPRRLRMLLFEIGLPLIPDLALAPTITIDNVKLVGPAGRERVLADFNRPPQEAVFLADGVATPFARTLFNLQQVETFVPDPNTYVTPAIFGGEFDPATVHAGEGSFRLTLKSAGAASGFVSFNPDRSHQEATAITFWARGGKGGERLAVTVEDALDAELRNPAPARSPRHLADGRLVEGSFVLTPDWKRYRVPRADLPDVDFRSLLAIRFRFGTPIGNEAGTTIYLDDIRWE